MNHHQKLSMMSNFGKWPFLHESLPYPFFDLPESVHLGAMRSLRSISDFNEKFT